MKKLVFILLMILLLSGCAGSPVSIPFLQTPTPPAPPQPTATPFSLRPTNTPNLFVLNTLPPTTTAGTGGTAVSGSTAILVATSTPLPLPTFTPTIRPTITLEPINANLFTPSASLFLSIQRSTEQLVWGACDGSRSVRFTVQVKPARGLRFVTLWYRLQDKYSSRQTDWGGGAILSDNDQGTYFYNLDLSQIDRYRYYEDAWLQYQFVASTVTKKVLSRSVVSQSDLSVTHCKVLNP